MKKTFLTLALAGTFGIAAAQSMTTGLPAAKPTVNLGGTPVAAAPTAVAAPAAAGSRPDPHINPFNGKLQSVEQIQRDLEETRMQTQLLEERLKQTNLAEEMKTVPLRKAVEVAQATTAVKKEEASQKEIEQNMRAPKLPVGAAARAAAPAAHVAPITVKKKPHAFVTKAVNKAAGASETAATAAPAAPAQQPRPTLVSVVNVGGARSAVLEFAGGTLVVADGEPTPFGVLHVHDQSSADIGGAPLRVHSATMARFVVSDAKAVTTNGSTQSMGAAAVATPVAAAPQAPTAAPSTLGLPAQANGPLPALPLPPSTPALAAPAAGSPATLTSGAKAQMPPLQLPPGVSVLPPPR